MINKNVEALRSLMNERGIDAYIIPTADFHESEYGSAPAFDIAIDGITSITE